MSIFNVFNYTAVISFPGNYSVSIQSLMKFIGSGDMMNNVKMQLEPASYITKYEFSLLCDADNCASASIVVIIVEQNRLPWFGAAWHAWTFTIKLSSMLPVNIYGYLVAEQRHIFVMPANANNQYNSSVSVHIDPLIPVMSLEPNDTFAQAKSLLYFAIEMNYYTDWMGAQEFCSSFGATLPSMTTAAERHEIHKLVLGHTAGRNTVSQSPHCRYIGPLCAIFLGLNREKVGF